MFIKGQPLGNLLMQHDATGGPPQPQQENDTTVFVQLRKKIVELRKASVQSQQFFIRKTKGVLKDPKSYKH